MKQNMIDCCPFREKSASRRLYLALARAGAPLTKSAIAKAAHLTIAKTTTLLNAYRNPMHRAPLDRIGVRVLRTNEGSFVLQACKPILNAKRPARGKAKLGGKNVKAKPTAAADEAKEMGKASRRRRATGPKSTLDIVADTPTALSEVSPIIVPEN